MTLLYPSLQQSVYHTLELVHIQYVVPYTFEECVILDALIRSGIAHPTATDTIDSILVNQATPTTLPLDRESVEVLCQTLMWYAPPQPTEVSAHTNDMP